VYDEESLDEPRSGPVAPQSSLVAIALKLLAGLARRRSQRHQNGSSARIASAICIVCQSDHRSMSVYFMMFVTNLMLATLILLPRGEILMTQSVMSLKLYAPVGIGRT
jgi:hypothetical protein